MMNTPREKVRYELLTDGLVDYVDLGAVNSQVRQHNSSASVSEVQRETLQTIRGLVSEGLFHLGDLSGEGGSLYIWPCSLEESLQKISDAYITHYDDKPGWVFFAWMELTDKGERLARALRKEAKT